MIIKTQKSNVENEVILLINDQSTTLISTSKYNNAPCPQVLTNLKIILFSPLIVNSQNSTILIGSLDVL